MILKETVSKVNRPPIIRNYFCSHQGYSQSRANDLEYLGQLRIFFKVCCLILMDEVRQNLNQSRGVIYNWIKDNKRNSDVFMISVNCNLIQLWSTSLVEGYFTTFYLKRLLKGLMHRIEYNDNLLDWQKIIWKEVESKKNTNKQVEFNIQHNNLNPLNLKRNKIVLNYIQCHPGILKGFIKFSQKKPYDHLQFPKQWSINQRNNIKLFNLIK
ncbi:unnamed protein product [Paramecium pentaurelia]|uniref:Uncharacterized protein n=1 Tax=Paramecium pentaurelia TaxID=43138 RepID=A0A8S1V8C1_9CILI|nr:unnamed protein product [Paramecium pentaurelia]